MQSLLVLTAVFAMMASYLETTQPEQSSTPQLTMAKIVRSQTPLQTEEKPLTVIAANHPKVPLNLKLPTVDSIEQYYFNSQTSVMKLFKADNSPEISYNAELVYDIEKGENITGGKVNVTIPFG